MSRIDYSIIGKQFGRLTVIDFYDVTDYGTTRWLCECNCPERNKRIVIRTDLVNGNTRSCGCYQKERTSIINQRHGMCDTRLYNIWRHMIRRCEAPTDISFKRYGAREISVCDDWRSFENFRDWALDNGYSDELTIDREDNDKNYCPENCRWVDQRTQQRNKRNTLYVEYRGDRRTIKEWSELFNVNYHTLRYRVQHDNLVDFENFYQDI